MSKAKLNYIVDALIGLAFLLSAVSGVVFLLPVQIPDLSSGSVPTLLGVTYATWRDLHTFSSLAMIAGVFLHLALHWRWVVAMTRCTFGQPKRKKCPAGATAPSATQATATAGAPLSRRRFLLIGCSAATALACGGLWVKERREAEASKGTLADGGLGGETATACPRGLVNDPYPGQCTLYTDTNGDGYCDFSTPVSAPADTAPTVTANAAPAATPTTAAATATPDAAPAAKAPTAAPTAETTAVPASPTAVPSTRCPHGLVNDPYPGRCRHYVDRNGNGFCDLSEV